MMERHLDGTRKEMQMVDGRAYIAERGDKLKHGSPTQERAGKQVPIVLALLISMSTQVAIFAPVCAVGADNIPAEGVGSEGTTGSAYAPTSACTGLAITAGTTIVNGANLPEHTITWTDATCAPRTALMVDQRANGTGYMRKYTYRVGGGDRACTGIASNGGAIQGIGYVENHLGTGPDDWTVATGGTMTVVLAGAHHAILEYSMPTHQINGTTIPTTVQWFFATGRSHPLFTVAQDARAYPAGNFGADSRSPYGSMNFPGDGTDLPIAGVSWGDTFKFVSVVPNTTNESTLLEDSSGWRYNESNSIPYVLAWTSGVDAEQGTVATSPISYQDQGSDPRVYPVTGFGKNQQDLNGPLPTGDDWAYQMMNYPDVPPGGTTDKKMAWGMDFGALGGFDNWGDGSLDPREFSRHRDSTTPWTGSRQNGLLLAYSTFVVFGPHSGGYKNGTTGQVVHDMENTQLATLSAAVGSVRWQGPRGVEPASNATVNYVPAGYNSVYSTWDLEGADDAADFTLTPAGGRPLVNPVFVIHGYTSGVPPTSVELDGVAAQPDVDYFLSVDPGANRLWLTVDRTVSTALHVRLVAAACIPPGITTQPLNQTVTTGQSSGLGVVANGTAALSYQWYQGASGNTTNPVGSNASIYVTPALFAPASYWVRISNACGTADSATAVISITSGCVGARIDLDPVSQTVASGGSATLQVLANGSAPLQYQWYQGPASDTSQPVGTDADSFVTPSLSSTTSYWVRVTNSCGTADSSTATVAVDGGGCVGCPTITRIKARTSKAGSPATILGTGFSKTSKQDIVTFGSLKARIKKATATSLKVTIPKVPKGIVLVNVVVNGKASNPVSFQVK